MSSVFSMELEGISNCWMMKDRMNMAPTSTAARPAMVSGKVSFSRGLFPSVWSSVAFSALVSKGSSFNRSLLHPAERSVPAGLIKKMNDLIEKKRHALSHCSALVFVVWRYERPIYKQWTTNDVLLWDETPVAAVKTLFAIIAHAEEVAGWHDQIFALDAFVQFQGPVIRHAVNPGGRQSGKLIAVCVVVTVFPDLVGLIQLFSVAIHLAVAQVNAVTRDADDPLYNVLALVLFVRMDEHHNVTAMHLPVRHHRSGVGGLWRRGKAVHEEMVTDEQRVLHGAGWNHKRSHHERNNEQA